MVGVSKEIGCFSHTPYRPKYVLLVFGIQTYFTCAELDGALTKLPFVSYMIAPSLQALNSQALSNSSDRPFAGSLHLLIRGFI